MTITVLKSLIMLVDEERALRISKLMQKILSPNTNPNREGRTSDRRNRLGQILIWGTLVTKIIGHSVLHMQQLRSPSTNRRRTTQVEQTSRWPHGPYATHSRGSAQTAQLSSIRDSRRPEITRKERTRGRRRDRRRVRRRRRSASTRSWGKASGRFGSAGTESAAILT